MLTAPDWTGGEDCTPEARDTCTNIPVENRSNFIGGGDVMPTISWTAGPQGTVGYAIVFHDLYNEMAHWAMWGIPADVLSVGPDAIPEGAEQAAAVGNAWFGSGACANTYELVVYALKSEYTPQGNAKQTVARDQLEGDDGTLVAARDFARVAPLEDCN